MIYIRNKIGIKAAMSCCLTLILMFVVSIANAAPKLTAEGAKKYFGDVNAPTEIDTRFGKKSLLPLQLAAGNKDEMGLNMIKALVEAGAIINKLGPDGDAALHTAASRNAVANLKLLIKLGADVNLKNKQEKTALLKAIDYRKLDVVKSLLNAGANPDISNSKGQTAIHVAANMGDIEMALKILPLLIQHGGDIEAKSKDGHTPLQIVLSLPGLEDKAVVEFLLDANANPNVSDSVSGSLLHEIAGGNQTDQLVGLLDMLVKAGANLDDQNNMFVQTPLHKAVFRACYHGELAITKALLAHGADASLKDKDGNSARKQGECNKQVSQLFASVGNEKKSSADNGSAKRLKAVIKAYADHIDKAGQAYQQAKTKAMKARGFSGLETRQNVQARQKLFADFKDKSMALIYLLKESKSLAWKAVQENKVEATQQEVEKAVVRKFGKRISEEGLKPLKAQFYWADAYFNVYTMLDQHWGAWSVDEGKHLLNAPDKSLQEKLNKEMQAIGELESYLKQSGK